MRQYPFLNGRKLFFFLAGCLAIQMFFSACTTPEKALADKKSYTEDDAGYHKKFVVDFDKDEKPLRYGYHYIVSSIPEGYRVRVFNPDIKVLTEVETYGTPNLTMLHGSYKSFWDDGSIRSQGIYQYGRKDGMWVESEPGRGKSTSGVYVSQRKEGEWTQLDTNGLIESIYTYHDDQLHGKFFLFDSTGRKINEGLYKSDSLISELFPQPKTTRPYQKSCQSGSHLDVYACSDASIQSVVSANIKYPALAREKKIEGSAMVQWDVLPNGTMANIRVPQGLCNEIEKECLRVVKLLGKWVPAYKDERAVKYTMSLPIAFKLE